MNKEALNTPGRHHLCHTEMLAEFTGVKDSLMMLAHGSMRSHVSTHDAAQEVPKRQTSKRLRYVIDLTYKTLRGLGVGSPKIALAALNPHSGEVACSPAKTSSARVDHCQGGGRMGLTVVGPSWSTAWFVKLRPGQYDAVIAVFHDQQRTACLNTVNPLARMKLALFILQSALTRPIVDSAKAANISETALLHHTCYRTSAHSLRSFSP